MATFREILVKVFCAKRYATREDAIQARRAVRVQRRSRRRSYAGDVSKNSALSRSFGPGIGLGIGAGGPKNNYGTKPGPGF
jgi:hypothetical protein